MTVIIVQSKLKLTLSTKETELKLIVSTVVT